VHSYLLVERGVSIMEAMWLEDLSKDQVYEFLFIASPLKFRGGTALTDPSTRDFHSAASKGEYKSDSRCDYSSTAARPRQRRSAAITRIAG